MLQFVFVHVLCEFSLGVCNISKYILKETNRVEKESKNQNY